MSAILVMCSASFLQNSGRVLIACLRIYWDTSKHAFYAKKSKKSTYSGTAYKRKLWDKHYCPLKRDVIPFHTVFVGRNTGLLMRGVHSKEGSINGGSIVYINIKIQGKA